MQHREYQREDKNERDGIQEVALAERLNVHGTALRTVHHRRLVDSVPNI